MYSHPLYNVYIFQILRTNGLDVGIILSKALESSAEEEDIDTSPSPRGTVNTTTKWMVSVENDSASEEEISEKYLGRILEASDESDNTATIDKATALASSSKKKNGGKGAGAVPKKVSFPNGQKSKHRGPEGTKANSRRNTRASRNADNIDMDALNDIIMKKPKKATPKPPKNSAAQGESVVEVKMATGTLFMYKGLKRRVEFIRTA